MTALGFGFGLDVRNPPGYAHNVYYVLYVINWLDLRGRL
jgi:hypothetical protein